MLVDFIYRYLLVIVKLGHGILANQISLPYISNFKMKKIHVVSKDYKINEFYWGHILFLNVFQNLTNGNVKMIYMGKLILLLQFIINFPKSEVH